MQIQNHVQAVFAGPVNGLLDIGKAFLFVLSFFGLHQIIVDRDPDMIQAPAADPGDVRLCNEVVIPFLCVVALGQPSAQIDPVLIAFPSLHTRISFTAFLYCFQFRRLQPACGIAESTVLTESYNDFSGLQEYSDITGEIISFLSILLWSCS